MRVTGQILGHRDFFENPVKTVFAHFSTAGKKPSKNHKKTVRRPSKYWKTVKKPSKNLKKTVPEPFFMNFGLEKPPRGGARACARAPFWWYLGAKTLKKPSLDPFLMVFLGFSAFSGAAEGSF